MIGYAGKYLISMDDNGRLAIPARLRKSRPMGISPKKQIKGYVISKWIDGCLGMFTEDIWKERLMVLFKDGSSFKRKNRIFSRHLAPNAYDVAPDSQGRITVPRDLIEEAGLSNEVLIFGAVQHIEIWDPARYKKFLKESISFEESADQLIGD